MRQATPLPLSVVFAHASPVGHTPRPLSGVDRFAMGKRVSAIMLLLALTTLPVPTLAHGSNEVVARQRVAALAMRLGRVLRAHGITAQHVFSAGYRTAMARIATPTRAVVALEMVEFQTFRNRADLSFVAQPINKLLADHGIPLQAIPLPDVAPVGVGNPSDADTLFPMCSMRVQRDKGASGHACNIGHSRSLS